MQLFAVLLFSPFPAIAIFLPTLFLLFGSWAPAFFWTYVATALWLATGLVLSLQQADPSETHLQPFLRARELLVSTVEKTSILERVKGLARRTARRIRLVSDMALWPQGFFVSAFILATRGVRQFAKTFLREPEAYNFPLAAALFTLVVAFVAYARSFWGASFGPYTLAFLWLVVAALVLRYVCYILRPGELLEDVRTSTEWPRITFLIVLAAEFASLILLLPVTAGGLTPAQVDLANLIDTASLAFRPQVWMSIASGTERSLKTVLTAIATTTFYFGVLTSATRGLTIGRTDDERYAVAVNQFVRGDYEAVRSTLLEIQQKGAHTLYLEIAALLSEGRVSEAVERARTLASLENAEADANTVHILLFGIPADKSTATWAALLSSALQADVDDAVLAVSIKIALNAGQESAVANFSGMLVEKAATYPVSNELVIRWSESSGEDMAGAYASLRESVPIPSTGLSRVGYICLLEFVHPRETLSDNTIGAFLDELEQISAELSPADAQSALICIGMARAGLASSTEAAVRLARIAEGLIQKMGRRGAGLATLLPAVMDEAAIRAVEASSERERSSSKVHGGLQLEPLARSSTVMAVARRIDPKDPQTWGKVARNGPCPCGSGKKYKHCHGRS